MSFSEHTENSLKFLKFCIDLKEKIYNQPIFLAAETSADFCRTEFLLSDFSQMVSG